MRWGRAAQISGQILERYGIPLRGTGLFLYMCSRCPVRVEKFGWCKSLHPPWLPSSPSAIFSHQLLTSSVIFYQSRWQGELRRVLHEQSDIRPVKAPNVFSGVFSEPCIKKWGLPETEREKRRSRGYRHGRSGWGLGHLFQIHGISRFRLPNVRCASPRFRMIPHVSHQARREAMTRVVENMTWGNRRVVLWQWQETQRIIYDESHMQSKSWKTVCSMLWWSAYLIATCAKAKSAGGGWDWHQTRSFCSKGPRAARRVTNQAPSALRKLRETWNLSFVYAKARTIGERGTELLWTEKFVYQILLMFVYFWNWLSLAIQRW